MEKQQSNTKWDIKLGPLLTYWYFSIPDEVINNEYPY